MAMLDHLHEDELLRLRQIEAEQAIFKRAAAQLQAEKQQLRTRAHMRRQRHNRDQADAQRVVI